MHARSAVTLVLVLALPAASASAQGSWEEPITLDRGTVSSPSAAVRADGRIAAAWLRRSGDVRSVRAMAEPAGGPTTVIQSSTRIADPEVATTSNGAVVVWTRSGRVETRRLSGRTGDTSNLSRLSPAGGLALDPTFVGGTGPTVLAWISDPADRDLQIAVPRTNGTFAVTLRYELPGLIDIDFVTTRGGGLLAAYTRRRDNAVDLVVAEQRPGSSRLVESVRLVTTAVPSSPSVAVTPAGQTIVAWTETDATGARIKASERPRGGAFAQAVTLPAGGQPSRLALLPKSDGSVLATWVATSQPSDVAPGTLQLADARGGQVQAIAGGVRDYTAAIDERGRAHIGWISGGSAEVRTVDANERVSSTRRLSAPGERALSLSMSAGERAAAAVWTTRDRVRLSRRP